MKTRRLDEINTFFNFPKYKNRLQYSFLYHILSFIKINFINDICECLRFICSVRNLCNFIGCRRLTVKTSSNRKKGASREGGKQRKRCLVLLFRSVKSWSTQLSQVHFWEHSQCFKKVRIILD